MKKSFIFSLVAAAALTACQTDSVSSAQGQAAQPTTERERQDFNKLRNAAATCASIRWYAKDVEKTSKSATLPISPQDQATLKEMLSKRVRLVHSMDEYADTWPMEIGLDFLDARGNSIFRAPSVRITSEEVIATVTIAINPIFVLSNEDYKRLSDMEPEEKFKRILKID